MSNMHLVTGYAGNEHVTAADHGSLYAALISSGSYVLDKGNKFAINKTSNNQVRVSDGDLLMQGRHCRVADGAVVDLPVESGQNGYKRRDLVCVRYLHDADTGVEDCNLIVIRGNPVAASPSDPEYVNGDIIGGALQKDFPLYRLNLNGTAIESIDTLFTVFPSIENNRAAVAAEFASVWAEMAGIDAGIPKIATGSYRGTGTAGSANPNSITLDFEPYFVYVQEHNTSSAPKCMFGAKGSAQMVRVDDKSEYNIATWSKTDVSWYASGTGKADVQFNETSTNIYGDEYGGSYIWVAIGK